jgi:hypothetical protein
MLVITFLREGDTYSHSKLDMLEYALENSYIDEMDIVDIMDMNLGLPDKVVEEYKAQAEYDVILFNKSGNQTVCNEGISREKAIQICSSEASKGQNYFAGFAPTGSYPQAKKGENFIVDGNEVINTKE